MSLRRKFSIFMVFVMLMTVFTVPASSYAAAAKNTIKMNKSVYTMKKGTTVKLKVEKSDAAKTKKIVWKSSNKKIATVTQKGKVIAKKKGKTTITAKVEGTKAKTTCKITVGTPVKKITLAETDISLKAGEQYALKHKLSPKKPSNKKVKYKTGDKSIATVTAKGIITAVSPGETTITVTAADGTGKKAKCNVVVTSAGAENDPNAPGGSDDPSAPGGSDDPNTPGGSDDPSTPGGSEDSSTPGGSDDSNAPGESGGSGTPGTSGGSGTTGGGTTGGGTTAPVEVTVTTQGELDAALTAGDADEITFQSDETVTIEIPQGNYTSMDLIINAPNADVTNSGNFASVTILAIAEDTYTEKGNNKIKYHADKGHVVIDKEGSAELEMKEEGGQSLHLENNGEVSKLHVPGKSELTIEGENSVPVEVTENATDTTITAHTELDVDAKAKCEMNIMPGGEHTKVTVDKKDRVPDVNGLGRIPVEVTEDNDITNVVAKEPADGTITETVTVEGSIQEMEDNGTYASGSLAGTKIYIVPYDGEEHDAVVTNCDSFIVKDSAKSGETDADGHYSISDVKLGNYWIIAKKDGFDPTVVNVCITSHHEKVFTVAVITVLKWVEELLQTTISGYVIDGYTGQPVTAAGLTVKLRPGYGNVTGDALQTATTNASGVYTFAEKVWPGLYTIEVLDLRSSGTVRYNSATKNIIALGIFSDTSKYNCVVDRQMYDSSGNEQVQFTLTWGDESSGASADLDAHLVDMKETNDRFHIWYNGDSVNDSGETVADLDVDDQGYEGPEHITIYKDTQEKYRFYVHDYSESGKTGSDKLAGSHAQVKVTIGDNTYTYDCPSGTGNLWYVCDYDETTRTLTPVNVLENHTYNREYIGLPEAEIQKLEVAEAQNRALEKLADFEEWLSIYEDSDAKTAYLNKVTDWKTRIESAASIAACETISAEIQTDHDALWKVDTPDLNREEIVDSFVYFPSSIDADTNKTVYFSAVDLTIVEGDTLDGSSLVASYHSGVTEEATLRDGVSDETYQYEVDVTLKSGMKYIQKIRVLEVARKDLIDGEKKRSELFLSFFDEATNEKVNQEISVIESNALAAGTTIEAFRTHLKELQQINDTLMTIGDSNKITLNAVTDVLTGEFWQSIIGTQDADGNYIDTPKRVMSVECYSEAKTDDIVNELKTNLTISEGELTITPLDNDPDGYIALMTVKVTPDPDDSAVVYTQYTYVSRDDI